MLLADITTLQIEPTSHCNAKCPHCPRFDVTHHDIFESTGRLHPNLTLAHLDFFSINSNLEIDRMINLSKVVLEGDKGDPMMHPEIESIIDFFCTAPSTPHVKLTTNGSIRSSEWWRKLAKKNYPNLTVTFSIDGLKDTNHFYRVGIDYDKVVKNASSFIDCGGQAIWKMIVFKHNSHQIAEIESLSQQLGFKSFESRQSDHNRFKKLEKWPVITEKGRYYIEPVEYQDRTVIHSKKPLLKKVSLIKDKKRLCPNLVIGHIYITHLNQVIPCCMLHFDTQLDYFGTEHLRKMTDGFDKLDLAKKKMSEILVQDFFQSKLRDSFISGDWHNTCEKSCKSQIVENMESL